MESGEIVALAGRIMATNTVIGPMWRAAALGCDLNRSMQHIQQTSLLVNRIVTFLWVVR